MAHSQPEPKYVCEGHVSDKENLLKEVTNSEPYQIKMSTSFARQKPAPSLEPSLMCSACVWKNCIILKADTCHDLGHES